MWHVWERGEVQRGVCCGDLTERDHDLGIDGTIKLNGSSRNRMGAGNGFFRFRIGICGCYL
jgi:hypothetical protein